MSGGSGTSWAEVKKLLDSPYVPPKDKRGLIRECANSRLPASPGGPTGINKNGPIDYDSVDHSELEKYEEKYDIGDATEVTPVTDEESLESIKTRAGNESYHDREAKSDVQDKKGELESLKDGISIDSVSVDTSDELLKKADTSLDMFKKWIPIDKKVPDECRSMEGPLSYNKDIKKRFYEQGGISFKHFMAEARRLKDMYDTLDELNGTVTKKLDSIYGEWSGEGADKSYDRYDNEIKPGVTDLIEVLEEAPGNIEQVVQRVYSQCREKADEALDLFTTTVGSATLDIAETVIDLANGNIDGGSREKVEKVAYWLDEQTGSDVVHKLHDDSCDLNQDTQDYVVTNCKKWITQSFNPDFYGSEGSPGLYLAFDALCDDAKEAVNDSWETLNSYFEDYENEFSDQQSDSQESGSSGSERGSPDASENPANTGSNGPGSATDSGSGASGGRQDLPENPEIPGSSESHDDVGMDSGSEDADTGESGTDDTSKAEVNPVSGDELEADPDTGDPYPIDPVSGKTVMDDGQDNGGVTVSQGENEITLSEPDEDGQMSIAIDNGSDEPVELELDFDPDNGESVDTPDSEQSGDAQGGPQDSEAQAAQPRPDEGGTQGDQPAGAEQDDLDSEGRSDSEGSTDSDSVYRPGSDGSIHIERDGLEITAERPDGPDGPTTVTLDDGSAGPVTYTLGDTSAGSDDSEPDSAPREAEDGQGAGEGAETLRGSTTTPEQTEMAPQGGDDDPVETGSTGNGDDAQGQVPGMPGGADPVDSGDSAVGGEDTGESTSDDDGESTTSGELEEQDDQRSDDDGGTNIATSAQGFFGEDDSLLGGDSVFGADSGSDTADSFEEASPGHPDSEDSGGAGLGAAPDASGSEGDPNSGSSDDDVSERGMDGGVAADDEHRDADRSPVTEALFGDPDEGSRSSRISGSLDADDNWFERLVSW